MTVNVADNDTPALRVGRRRSVTLTEGGSIAYGVTTQHPPSGDVMVSVESLGHGGGDGERDAQGAR